jgi:hypothetical protein
MAYSNEANMAAQIANTRLAASAGDMDNAFRFLDRALDCSMRTAVELAEIDAVYAEIKS